MRSVNPRILPKVLILILCSAGLAQTSSTPTMKVEAKTVLLPVTVRDKHGKLIQNLTKADFLLNDDGKPQTLNYFALDTNLPLTLGLLVDTSRSQRDALADERTASQRFFDQMLDESKDRAFLIQFDREVELLRDLTSSKEKLRDGLDHLGAPQLASQDTSSGSQSTRGGGTTLYDAIYLASDELMAKQQGRKALIVLTDGVDRGSKETLNSAIEAAERADTTVYAIYFKGQEQGGGNPGMGRHGGMGGRGGMGGGWPGGGYPGGGYPGGRGGTRPESQPHVDGKKILQQICGETGGYMFEAKKEKIDDVYKSIAEELRSQYVLGYTPDKSAPPGYHKLELMVKRKDVYVQSRAGYYKGE